MSFVQIPRITDPARWRFQAQLLLLDWHRLAPAIACVAALVLWLLLRLQVLPTLLAELGEAQRTLAQARAVATATPENAEVRAARTRADLLQNFYQALGERHYAEQQLKTLFALAAKNGLQPSQGDYKFSFNAAGGFYSYQVVLPLRGKYGALRQFCERALLAIPFAALEQIEFRRDAIANDVLDARLHLTIYFRQSDRPQLRSETAE